MTGTVVASAAAVPCSSADVQDVTTRLTKIVAQKEQEWKEVYTLNMLSLQAALQSVEDKNKALETAHTQLRSDFTFNEGLLTKRALAIEQLEAQCALQEARLQEQQEQQQTLHAQCEAKEAALATLRGTLQHREHLLKETQQLQQTYRTEYDSSLAMHRQEAAQQLQFAQARIKKLETEMMRHRHDEHARQADLEAKWQEEHQAQLKEREERWRQTKDEFRTLQSAFNKQTVQLEEAQERYAEMKANAKSDREAQWTRAEAQRRQDEEQHQACERLQSTVQRLERALQQKEAQLAKAHTDHDATQQSVQTLAGEIANLRAEIDQRDQLVRQKEEQIGVQAKAGVEQQLLLEQKMASHREEVAKWRQVLQQVMEQITEEKAKWDARMATEEEKQTLLQLHVTKQEEDNRHLQGELMEWLDKIKAAEQEAQHYQKEAAALKIEHDKRQQQSDTYEAHVARLEALLAEERQATEQLRHEQANAEKEQQSQHDQLRTVIRSMREDMEALEARDTERSMTAMQAAETAKEMAAVQDHNASLRQTLDLLRNECDARVEALLSTQDRLRETEVQLAEVKQAHQQLTEEQRHRERLPDPSREWRAKAELLQRQLDKLVAEVQRLLRERETLIALSNELRAEQTASAAPPSAADDSALLTSKRPKGLRSVPKTLAQRALLVKSMNDQSRQKGPRNYNLRD